MAEFTDGQDLGFVANSDLSSGYQFHAVLITADGMKCDVASTAAAAAKAIGILQNRPKANEFAWVRIFGNTKVAVGAAGTANDQVAVQAGAGGWVATFAVTSGTTAYTLGTLLTTAGSGAVGSMLLLPSWRTS